MFPDMLHNNSTNETFTNPMNLCEFSDSKLIRRILFSNFNDFFGSKFCTSILFASCISFWVSVSSRINSSCRKFRMIVQKMLISAKDFFWKFARPVIISSKSNTLRMKYRPVIISKSVSFLFNTIIFIVLSCSKKKMFRINTLWIVATMANILFQWIDSIINRIGNSMCSVAFMFYGKFTISLSRKTCYPIPTFRGGIFYEFCFKAFNI